jgi:sugar lactone lactonase YvrE
MLDEDAKGVFEVDMTSVTHGPVTTLFVIPWRDDKTALVIGPTGIALAANGTFYIADTLANVIPRYSTP